MFNFFAHSAPFRAVRAPRGHYELIYIFLDFFLIKYWQSFTLFEPYNIFKKAIINLYIGNKINSESLHTIVNEYV